MNHFTEKSLIALGAFYVYGLIDPRTGKLFYIGKGSGNRVFEHEHILDSQSESLKRSRIAEIQAQGLEVEKVIIHSNLTEAEAFAAEAALINVFRYLDKDGLTNLAAGHHSRQAMPVDAFEKTYGAEVLLETDIRHSILIIKINKLYREDMPQDALYDTVRGVWRASLKRVKKVDYVFGVYNSLIVAVYKPTQWYICKQAQDRLPQQDKVLTAKTENRVFFIDENFEQGLPMDENAAFYHGKSIAGLKLNQGTQNPVSYLNL